jgi:hypothetical protein
MLCSMPSPIVALLTLTEEQWGLFTRQHARLADVGDRALARMLGDGMLERVAHGVYRVRGAPPPPHLALKAAWLQLDQGAPIWERLAFPEGLAVVSHGSAAALHGLVPPGEIHEFTVASRRQTRRPDVRTRVESVRREEWQLLDGLPATVPGRTVADLLAALEEPLAAAHAAAAVLRQKLEDPTELAYHLAPFARRHGFRAGAGPALLDWLLSQSGAEPQLDWSSPGWLTNPPP